MDLSFIRGNREKKAEESPKKNFFQRNVADNTMKFFGSVSEKKNGLWSNISSKLDSVVHLPKREETKQASPDGTSPEKTNRRMSQPTVSETDNLYAASRMTQSVILNGHTPAPQSRSDVTSSSQKRNVKAEVHTNGNHSTELAGRVKVKPDVQINFDTPLYEQETSSADSSQNGSPQKPVLQRRASYTAEEVFLDNLEKRKGLLVVDNSAAVENLASPNRTMREFNFKTDDNEDELFLVPVPSDQNLMDFDKADFSTYESIRDSDGDDDHYNMVERYDSDSSSDGEGFGGTVLGSHGSNGSLAEDLDEESARCKEFMIKFVDAVFAKDEISQREKAQFGQYCQESSGRLWFARSINSKRVESKSVDEAVFYQLVQYFALVLFECNDADDFTPAKTLMNMCFTFYYETKTASGQTNKHYLYSYLKDQLIWRSLRFWNAAFFDAVQCERSRRPVSTNKDDSREKIDDRTFQENVIFGQLGTFACNMRAFGLSRDLCLEFIRKQSVIGNLKRDQVQLLKENIEKWSD